MGCDQRASFEAPLTTFWPVGKVFPQLQTQVLLWKVRARREGGAYSLSPALVPQRSAANGDRCICSAGRRRPFAAQVRGAAGSAARTFTTARRALRNCGAWRWGPGQRGQLIGFPAPLPALAVSACLSRAGRRAPVRLFFRPPARCCHAPHMPMQGRARARPSFPSWPRTSRRRASCVAGPGVPHRSTYLQVLDEVHASGGRPAAGWAALMSLGTAPALHIRSPHHAAQHRFSSLLSSLRHQARNAGPTQRREHLNMEHSKASACGGTANMSWRARRARRPTPAANAC